MAWYNGDEVLSGVSNTGSQVTYKDSKATGSDFGSPSFTAGDGPHAAEDVEVKFSHRFRVKFGVFRAVGHHIKTISKPSVEFAEVEVPKLNSTVYFAGRKTQSQAEVTLDDSLDGEVQKATQTQLQKQANFDNNYHAKSSAAYFFNMTAEDLAGDGSLLGSWFYNKCVVMTCDYGTLDYSDGAGLSEISLSIRYANFTTWLPEPFAGGSTSDDGTNGGNMNDAESGSPK